MEKCGVCKRTHEHLGMRIKTTWCEKTKGHICQDCCFKNGGRECDWKSICWNSMT